MPNQPLTPANQAVEEIKAILRKHDLAGMVFVQSPDEAAYLREITPTWSCTFFKDTPQGLCLRIRSKLADYPSKEAQKASVEATTGMLMAFLNEAERNVEDLGSVVAMIARHFPDIRHWERHNP